MEITTQTAPVSKAQIWAGRIISALPILFLLFDGVIHLTRIAPVVDSLNQLGYPIGLALGLGIIELVCVVLYVVPPTSVLGAILLTGYLGGAVASNLRIGAPLFSNALFPVYVGVLLWAWLYLRSNRLRALLPLRR